MPARPSPRQRRRPEGFAGSLTQPYCGANGGFEAVRWLDIAGFQWLSLALMPLRRSRRPAFGLLVLGSPDPTRYSADMGTEFLPAWARWPARRRLLPRA
jgi:uncharacterized protein YigA (DUF484 family)